MVIIIITIIIIVIATCTITRTIITTITIDIRISIYISIIIMSLSTLGEHCQNHKTHNTNRDTLSDEGSAVNSKMQQCKRTVSFRHNLMLD